MTAIDNRQHTIALNRTVATTGHFPRGPGGIGSSLSLATIRTYGFNFLPGGSADTDGSLLQINSNQGLFSLLGTVFGGDGRTTFGLPDLDGILAIGQGQGPGLTQTRVGQSKGADFVTLTINEMPDPPGNGALVNNVQSSLGVVYAINTGGNYPSDSSGGGHGFLGQVQPFAVGTTRGLPSGWVAAEGQVLQVTDNAALFSIIGTIYGGDGHTTFALPDLRGRTIVGAGQGPGDTLVRLGDTPGSETTTLTNSQLPSSVGGSSAAVNNVQPALGLNYLVALEGLYPPRESGSPDPDTPFLGEIVAFAGNFAPRGYALAQGQLLAINSFQALFSLFGTTYGGDGRTTFALPDLRGRSVVDESASQGIGVRSGADMFTLTDANLAAVDVPDITGTPNVDDLVGTGFAERIFALESNDTINAGRGDDVIDGGPGSDTMAGGLGNDLYYVDNAGDVIQEAPGRGTVDQVAVNTDFVLTAGAEVELFTTNKSGGTRSLSLTGNEFSQTIVGNAGDNIIADGGGAGADFLRGLGGNDTYIVRNSGTTIEEKSSAGANDRVAAGVDYTLADGVFVELLTTTSTGATAGIDLTGNTGAQTIVGNAANNTISDGGGAAANGDILKGLAGSDFYIVRNEGTLVRELVGQGAFDRVAVSKSYALAAGAEVESLRTTSMHGTNAIDLTGNAFGQQIIGNAGANTLTGNGGNDTFFFGSALGGGNIDTITDYNVADDQFELVRTIFNGIAATGALDADAFVANTTGNAEDATDRIIYNSNTGGVFYDPDGTGVTAATQFATVTAGLGITAADFNVI